MDYKDIKVYYCDRDDLSNPNTVDAAYDMGDYLSGFTIHTLVQFVPVVKTFSDLLEHSSIWDTTFREWMEREMVHKFDQCF